MSSNTVCSIISIRALFTVVLTIFGFALYSSSAGGEDDDIAPVSVVPTVSLSAGATSIAYNASTTIIWSSTNSSSCASSGGGGTGPTGSFDTGPQTTTTTYTVTCVGAGGSASQNKTITVISPTVTAFADAGGGNVTVTTANTLTNGVIITIGGTTHYNGNYTVANANHKSFTIVANFKGNDAAGTWHMAGGRISRCSTTATIGKLRAITLSNVPSRFTGVAPLPVFFDASGTTATATTRPFHDLEYRWNFGESAAALAALPGGANWTNGSTKGSRNLATGPEAAHVYETPGVYIVALSATDGTNVVSNSCTQIVVQNPDLVFAGTNTTCVGATSVPVQGVNGCPAGANTVQQPNFVTAISSYALTGKRVLFQRGDTFTAASTARITQTGPGIVGAFGTGTMPSVQMTGNDSLLTLSSATTPGIKDWRVMDIDLNGVSSGTNTVGINADGGFNQLLALRLNIRNTAVGIAGGPDTLDWYNTHNQPGHTMFDEWSIVDSTITSVAGCGAGCAWRIFLSGTRTNIQGNYLDNMGTGGSHTLRSGYTSKGVISNNYIARPGSYQHALKLHGPSWVGGVPSLATLVTPATAYTEQVVIADNEIIGADDPWIVSIGPMDGLTDQRVRNIIVERNWNIAGAATQIAFESSAVDATFRNNICDMTGAAGQCVGVGQRGVEPVPNNVHVYNNTFYSGSATILRGVNIGTATNTVVINNLVSAPLAPSPVVILNTGTGLVESNDLVVSSPFVVATPVAPADFSLKPLPNPARNAGLATAPVFSDSLVFTLPNFLQPSTSPRANIGAVE